MKLMYNKLIVYIVKYTFIKKFIFNNWKVYNRYLYYKYLICMCVCIMFFYYCIKMLLFINFFACLLIWIISNIIVLTSPFRTRKTWILYTKKEDRWTVVFLYCFLKFQPVCFSCLWSGAARTGQSCAPSALLNLFFSHACGFVYLCFIVPLHFERSQKTCSISIRKKESDFMSACVHFDIQGTAQRPLRARHRRP